jgi:hypothetical protein
MDVKLRRCQWSGQVRSAMPGSGLGHSPPGRAGTFPLQRRLVAWPGLLSHVSTLRQYSPYWQANPFSLSLPAYREGRELFLLYETSFVPEPDIGSLGSHTCFDVRVGDLASPETQMEG